MMLIHFLEKEIYLYRALLDVG